NNRRRKGAFAENPAGDVHLMDALVTKIAIAGGPNPMPIVMQPFSHQGFLRGGTAPEIVIDVWGDLLRAGDVADAGASFVAKPTRADNFAEIACVEPGNAFLQAFA